MNSNEYHNHQRWVEAIPMMICPWSYWLGSCTSCSSIRQPQFLQSFLKGMWMENTRKKRSLETNIFSSRPCFQRILIWLLSHGKGMHSCAYAYMHTYNCYEYQDLRWNLPWRIRFSGFLGQFIALATTCSLVLEFWEKYRSMIKKMALRVMCEWALFENVLIWNSTGSLSQKRQVSPHFGDEINSVLFRK